MDSITTELIKKADIKDVVTRLFIGTDNRDWAVVRACFAENVRFDMSSMTGEEPGVIPAEAVVKGWEERLKNVDATHHQAGNFLIEVTSPKAKAFCYGTVFHYLADNSGRNTRTFVGSYEFGFMYDRGRWKIDAFKFNLKFIDGNPALENS